MKSYFNNLPIRYKFVVPMVMALILMLGSIYIYFPLHYRNNLLQAYSREAARTTELFSVAVSYALIQHSFEHVQKAVQSAQIDVNVLYIYIFDENGKQLVVYNPDNIILPDDVLLDQFSIEKSEEALVVKQEIRAYEEEILGNLILGYSLKNLKHSINNVRIFTIFSAFFALVFGFLFICKISKRVTNSISNLYSQMQEIIDKESYASNVPVSSNDEVGRLAAVFNKMMVDLRLRHQRLVESQERYQNLFENAPAMNFSLDRSGRILDCNQRAQQTSGCEKSHIILSNLGDFLKPVENSKRNWQVVWKQISKSENVKNVELQLVRNNRPPLDVLLNSSKLKCNGKIVSTVSTEIPETESYCVALSDISRLKQIEREIIQNNEELSALNSIIRTVNENLELETMVEKSLKKLMQIFSAAKGWITIREKSKTRLVAYTGFNPKSDIERTFHAICGSHKASKFCKVCESVRSRNNTEIIEGVVKGFETNQKYFRICVPLIASGRWIGTYVLLFENKKPVVRINKKLLTLIQYELGIAVMHAKLFEQLRIANQKLKELDRLKSNFVSDASHHLRTPLTLIKGGIEIARQWEKNPVKNQEVLSVVEEETEYLIKIVENLLTLAKADSHNLVNMQDAIDFSSLLKDQLKHALLIADEKGVGLNYQYAKNCFVCGDPNRLGEVIFNLLENAVKYTPSGQAIQVNLSCSEDWVLLQVTDTGIGIPENDLDKIFERFYRGAKSCQNSKGTGLGLAICKSIVQAHGGKIRVFSTLKKGSTFEIRLKKLVIQSEIPEN